jgi:hypothetical protein
MALTKGIHPPPPANEGGPGGSEAQQPRGKRPSRSAAGAGAVRDEASARTSRSTSGPAEKVPTFDLHHPTVEDWQSQTSATLEQYYAQAESDFFRIVDDYLVQANLAAERYKQFSRSHARWRLWTIIATGALAAINVCAAFDILNIPLNADESITLPKVLNAVAALYAGCLTVFGNVENFFNKGEKAAGFRESRDLLLNLYREYCFDWFYYVEAYGKTPRACVNAGRLYQQLVDRDQELRQKLKQLTEVQGRSAGETGTPRTGH